MNKKFLLILFFLFIIINSCKKENPAEPEDPAPAGNTIGAQGGTLKLGDAQVNILGGTFSSDQKLNLEKTTVPPGHETDANSNAYKLENIPINFSKPIEIGVKIAGQITGDTILAVKVPSYIVSGDKLEDRIIYLKGKLVDGVVTAKIDNLTEASFAKVSGSKDEGKFVIYFWSKINQVSYITSKNHFRINYPLGIDKSTIIDVGQILDDCYKFIDELGFKFTKRSNWPMDINIVNRPGVYGEYVSSKRSMNYDIMEIDRNSLNNEQQLKATLIHELFHAAQTMYNPHWNFTSSILGAWKGGYEHLWIDEAVSTWSSYAFLKDPNFTDNNVNASKYLILSGISTIKSDAANYGYGMSIFIKYLVNKYGEKSLVKIYEQILKKAGSYYSLSSICAITIDLDWYDYVEKLLLDKVDPAEFSGQSFIVGNAARKQITELKTVEETLTLKMGALSSQLYRFEFPAQIEASKNAQITFSTSAGEICIFRSNSKYGELKRITTTVSEYTLTNLKDVIDKNDRIIIAVSNGSVMPTDGTKDVTFKYKFEEAVDLSKIQSVSMVVRFAARETGGSIVDWEAYALPKFSPSDNWRGYWVGNKFICDFNMTKFDAWHTNVSGTFTLTYDFVKKEMIEVVYDLSYITDSTRSAKTKIILHNLPLSEYNTQAGPNFSYYSFIKLGESVCSFIKELSYTETNLITGQVTNVTKSGCNAKSQIWIKLNEF
jgi:hypothetical protein